MARHAKVAALALFFLASAAWAGPPMDSETNSITRDVVNGGGGDSSSTNNSLIGSFSEEVVLTTTASSANLIRSGWSGLHAFPGKVTDLAGLPDVTASSVTLQWTSPGYDGGLGGLMSGSTYFIRVASHTAPGTFSDHRLANVSFSTSGVLPGATVNAGATGLQPNTTYWARLWTIDADGDLSYASSISTFVTLAMPVTLQSESFVNVYFTSVAAQWVARPSLLQDVSSMTAEGYVVEASSTNFGALTAGGAVYSSATWNVLLSTLTLAIAPANLCETHYFRAASLNWGGLPNYTALGSTRAPGDYGVIVSTQDLDVGNVDVNTEIVISTSLLLSNPGCPVTYKIQVTTITPGSTWIVSTTSGTDAFTVQAIFNSVQPAAADFDDIDKITDVAASATPTKFAADQNGAAVPVTEDRLVWFKLGMPRIVSTEDSQQVRVTVYAIPP